ncbi:Vitamin B12 import ATP-binding protein BtuD [subsurface metagenome]
MPEIRIKNLCKEFKDVVAVRDVTITFPTATVTCLLGPSGCGKTTLLRMIAGLETPTAGDVYFDDERVTGLVPGKRNIGMVFQYPVVYRGLNVYRNIELPLLEDKLSERERHKRVEDVVEILGLKASVDKDITQLDNSERQKVAVARAIARKPQIILFDEPLTNVDVSAKTQLKQTLKDLTRQIKQTIIYVTHDQTEAMTLADKIALMKDGIIVQQDKPRKLYNYPNNMFGGWFLGNPGMNFIEVNVETIGDSQLFNCPLIPVPVNLSGIKEEHHINIGIRPEHIRINKQQTPMAVRGDIVRKSIVIGGQYLVVIKVGDLSFKAKIRPEFGYKLKDGVWVEIPFKHITLFGQNGHHIDAKMSVNG